MLWNFHEMKAVSKQSLRTSFPAYWNSILQSLTVDCVGHSTFALKLQPLHSNYISPFVSIEMSLILNSPTQIGHLCNSEVTYWLQTFFLTLGRHSSPYSSKFLSTVFSVQNQWLPSPSTSFIVFRLCVTQADSSKIQYLLESHHDTVTGCSFNWTILLFF